MPRKLYLTLMLVAAPLCLLLPLPSPTAAQKQAPAQAPTPAHAADNATDAALKQAEAALAAATAQQKGAAVLRALGKAAARKDKRRQVEALSTDAMDRLGELARAQGKLCKSIDPSGDAKANQSRAELIAAMADRMRELIDATLAPLWSQLPMKALRAGQMDFAAVHARVDAAVLAQKRAVVACQGKLNGATLPTPEQLTKAYDAAFEAGVSHALTQHKRRDRAEKDLELALRGFQQDRRAAVEARLRAALTAALE